MWFQQPNSDDWRIVEEPLEAISARCDNRVDMDMMNREFHLDPLQPMRVVPVGYVTPPSTPRSHHDVPLDMRNHAWDSQDDGGRDVTDVSVHSSDSDIVPDALGQVAHDLGVDINGDSLPEGEPEDEPESDDSDGDGDVPPQLPEEQQGQPVEVILLDSDDEEVMIIPMVDLTVTSDESGNEADVDEEGSSDDESGNEAPYDFGPDPAIDAHVMQQMMQFHQHLTFNMIPDDSSTDPPSSQEDPMSVCAPSDEQEEDHDEDVAMDES